jgi:acetylornithine deacetylase/succinyl-diaminopimelate desuccinylase family protein
MNEINISPQEKDVLACIDKDEIIGFLQALIQQRSDYPPGDCRGAVKIVADKLNDLGIDYDVYTNKEHQPNLIANLGDINQHPILMYHAHIDTVQAGDHQRWSVDPFGGDLIDGNIYGRGAGDDKVSVAVQIMSLIALARAGIPVNGSLRVVVVSDEETGGLYGTQWLHEQRILGCHALVVGEQTNNCIAIAERVACGIDITVYGKSAHGAMPWSGENAILKAIGAVGWLRSRLFPRLEARQHPYLPPPTLNIGKIQGGAQWNIVADQCKIEMDRRLLPGETREQAIAEIREILEDYSTQVEPLRYELTTDGEVATNINTSPDDPFVLKAHEALRDLTGEARPLTGYAQTSDGRWFAGDGIPIIIFGPSDPSVGHAANEHVSVSQLIEATQFLTLLAVRQLNPNGT